MKITAILLLFALTGCADYTHVQMRLAEQARRGVAMWHERESQRDTVAQRQFDSDRRALDAAFDADVKERGQLQADWVIEARKAYAIGLAALERERSAALSGNQIARDNAAAADAALAKLVWLQTLQFDLWNTLERRER